MKRGIKWSPIVTKPEPTRYFCEYCKKEVMSVRKLEGKNASVFCCLQHYLKWTDEHNTKNRKVLIL